MNEAEMNEKIREYNVADQMIDVAKRLHADADSERKTVMKSFKDDGSERERAQELTVMSNALHIYIQILEDSQIILQEEMLETKEEVH